VPKKINVPLRPENHMFGFNTKRNQQPPIQAPSLGIRDTLFGDMSLDNWIGEDDAAPPPWAQFRQARQHWRQGDLEPAEKCFREIIATPALEPRHYLQAWHFLRQMGHKPETEGARKVLGAVVEVGLSEGLDIVAAYSDGTARYYNYSGAAVIWERPNMSLDQQIKSLLSSTFRIAMHAGIWDQARPSAPCNGTVRLSALTPAGLIFGEGPMDIMLNDKVAGSVLEAAQLLMEGLIAVSYA